VVRHLNFITFTFKIATDIAISILGDVAQTRTKDLVKDISAGGSSIEVSTAQTLAEKLILKVTPTQELLLLNFGSSYGDLKDEATSSSACTSLPRRDECTTFGLRKHCSCHHEDRFWKYAYSTSTSCGHLGRNEHVDG